MRAVKIAAPPPDELAEVWAVVRELQTANAALSARVEALERRGRGPRDDADVNVFRALAETTTGRNFTARELFQHGRASERLRAAVEAADIENPRQLGKLCRRLERQVFSGFSLMRCNEESRDGILWRVVKLETRDR